MSRREALFWGLGALGCVALALFSVYALNGDRRMGPPSAAASVLSQVVVQDPHGDLRPLAQLADAPLNVILLFSPRYHCVSCLGTVRQWEANLASWPPEKVSAALVVDGTQSDLAGFLALKEDIEFSGLVLFDPEGRLRQILDLPQDPMVIGISGDGEVKFALSLSDALWSRISFEEDFVGALIWESLPESSQ
ncbi:MAG TPA: hypothetical protein VLU25_01010 [Acidobacteriota bacterium]|nr:hypothetical protein [Acidobacteriota bacterium]